MSNFDNNNKWAIWIKTAKSWLLYKTWTLNVEWVDYKITMFDNTYKKNDNQPDFNIVIEKITKTEEEKANKYEEEFTEIVNNRNKKQNNNEEIDIEDIPF